MLTLSSPQLLSSTTTIRFFFVGCIGPLSFITHLLRELFTFFSSIFDSTYPMTKTPAKHELLQRPVWDPAPGTACLWQCISEKPLAMHRLSDRVLGGLYIAISSKLIKSKNCELNESDLSRGFHIRYVRSSRNLGHGLLTPDGKAVVSIPTGNFDKTMVLRGSGNATANLPVVPYDPAFFKAIFPNWEQWRDELIYLRRPDGALDVTDFASYPEIDDDSTPADWPNGLTRDRMLASEMYYRYKNRK